jgi:hypothetical protein
LLKKNLHPALRSGSYFFSQSLAVQPGCSGPVCTKSHGRRLPTGLTEKEKTKHHEQSKKQRTATAGQSPTEKPITGTL